MSRAFEERYETINENGQRKIQFALTFAKYKHRTIDETVKQTLGQFMALFSEFSLHEIAKGNRIETNNPKIFPLVEAWVRKICDKQGPLAAFFESNPEVSGVTREEAREHYKNINLAIFLEVCFLSDAPDHKTCTLTNIIAYVYLKNPTTDMLESSQHHERIYTHKTP